MTTDLLRDLVRVKAVFQLRAIEAIIRGPASVDEHRNGEDAQRLEAKPASAVGESRDAPPHSGSQS